MTSLFLTLFALDLSGLLNQPQAWGIIAGVLTPLLVEVVKQPALPSRWVRPLALLVSVVVGFLTVLASGTLDPTNLLTTIAVVLAASEAAYRKLWPADAIAAVNAHTNVIGRKRRTPYSPEADYLA